MIEKFEDLKGKTLVEVKNNNDKELIMVTSEGDICRLYHYQDCCESVTIEDINGNLDDLIDSPLTMAEEATSNNNPIDADEETIQYQDSFTWTFYKLATVKGYVTIRWYGESNGYYSEEVDFSVNGETKWN